MRWLSIILLAMHLKTPEISKAVLTGVGLAMFAVALMLDHYHPHNQGIADITHSIYSRFNPGQGAGSASASLTYISPLPQARPKAAPKIADPTAANAQMPAADKPLPTIVLANGQADPNAPATIPADNTNQTAPPDRAAMSAKPATPANANADTKG